MKRVGEILKEEREKRGLSLHEVGLSLKINHKTLKAIEDGDQAQLPAKTFLRGFVRSYAQYLRLDVDTVLSQLQAEVGSTRPDDGRPKLTSDPGQITSTPSPEAAPKNTLSGRERPRIEESIFSERRLTYILGSTLLFVVIIFVAKTIDKYQHESRKHTPELSLEQKLAPLTTSGSLSENVDPAPPPSHEGPSAVIGLSSGSVAALSATTTPPPVATPTTTPPPVRGPAPTPIAAPAPVATPVQLVRATPTPIATPAPATQAAHPTPTGTPTEKPIKPIEVIVEALNKVDIRYSFDGEKFQSISLNSDELYTFKSKTLVKLEVSDGGAVSLIVNGRERGVPGVIGKPVTLSYPK